MLKPKTMFISPLTSLIFKAPRAARGTSSGDGFRKGRSPTQAKLIRALSGILLLLTVSFNHPTGYAQVTSGTISGTVKDRTGTILPGVAVHIKNLDTGITRTIVTDGEGRYHAPGLALGNYEVKAELSGFRAEIRTGIKLTVGREAAVDFTLQVGEITEEVVVTGEAPLVESTSSALAGLVDEKKIRDLPLNGRSFSQLVLLEAGVNPYLNNTPGFFNGRGLKITVQGARFNYNSFLLDGTDVNDVYNNTPGSVAGVLLGVETVREFKTLTHNFSAEYGRAAGAVVNAVTKSGTNELHGTAFEFHRNSALDAKNFFDPPDKPIPGFKRNQFGFTLGGPIKRNKTFFFGSYEGLRERLGVTKVALVPNRLAREGGIVPVNPVVVPYLNGYPLPNGRDLGGGIGEFLFSFKQPSTENFFVVKTDHKLSDSDSFFVRYTFDDGSVTRLTNNIPLFQEPEVSRNQYATIEEKKIISPNILNTFRFGFNRSTSAVVDEPVPGISVPPPWLPGARFMGLLTVAGLTPAGTDFRLPISNVLNLFEYSDDVVFTKGAHSLKGGFIIKRFQYNNLQDAHPNGTFTFADLAAFISGTPVVATGRLPGADVTRSLTQSLFGFYVQDDFKMGPHMTWNLGLRYELITVPREKFGRMAGLRSIFDPATTVGPPFENPSLKNFAPRLGFAWDPFKDGRTSIRGGFGIFHDQIITIQLFPNMNLVSPFWVLAVRFRPPFPNPLAGLNISQIPHGSFVNQFDLDTPYMTHYNLTFQREVSRDTVFTVGYAGSRGVHLSRNRDANTAVPQVLPDGRKFFPPGAQRRNPNLGFIRYRSTDANSFYNSLQLSLNKRFSQGLQFQASYTLGKSIDDSTQINTSDANNNPDSPQNSDDRKSDRGLSVHDIRHNFTLNYTYDVPIGPGGKFGSHLTGVPAKLVSGWQMNGITTVTSGNPFTININFNNSRSLNGTGGIDRPNLRPGRSKNPRLGRPDRWFDPTAFEVPPTGFFGSLGRGTLRGPGLVAFDFSLVKNTYINEKVNVQFRTELFNVFNRPNFATPLRDAFGPGGQILPTAGKITNTVTTSRQIQFALKIIF